MRSLRIDLQHDNQMIAVLTHLDTKPTNPVTICHLCMFVADRRAENTPVCM
jgi:hypothetical protein